MGSKAIQLLEQGEADSMVRDALVRSSFCEAQEEGMSETCSCIKKLSPLHYIPCLISCYLAQAVGRWVGGWVGGWENICALRALQEILCPAPSPPGVACAFAHDCRFSRWVLST